MRDPLSNPFTPGYGALPRVFAGREVEFRDLEVMAERSRAGIYEQARRVQGVRGIGKTVLLGEFEQWAVDGGWWVTSVSVAPGAGLIGRLARSLAATLVEHSVDERVGRSVVAVLRVLAAVGLRYGAADWHLEYRGRPVEPGAAVATGDPQEDLRRLLVEVALLARERGTGLVLLVDEAQNTPTADLGPLLYGLQDAQKHVLTTTDRLSGRTLRTTPPLAVVLAGLPNLPDVIARAAATFMSRSKPVALGALPDAAVRQALPEFTGPAGVEWDGDALDRMLALVEGYPYFLHVFGYHAWQAGDGPVITVDEVERGAVSARPTIAAFYDERLTRLTALQRRVVDAVAELPPGQRSAERIAALLGRGGSETLGSTLRRLVDAGILLRPGRGTYDLALPGLDRPPPPRVRLRRLVGGAPTRWRGASVNDGACRRSRRERTRARGSATRLRQSAGRGQGGPRSRRTRRPPSPAGVSPESQGRGRRSAPASPSHASCPTVGWRQPQGR